MKVPKNPQLYQCQKVTIGTDETAKKAFTELLLTKTQEAQKQKEASAPL